LSHPLIAEAAETLFVPVAIRNNTSGDVEARVRESFEEPAWNNPVVRFLAPPRRDLLPRLAREWTVSHLAQCMSESLEQAERAVPAWFSGFVSECLAADRGLETAIFGMT